MSITQLSELEAWGKTVDAREKLGELMSKLVRASLVPALLREVRFLYGVATQLPSWDGKVDTAAANEFLPEGRSVWELGAGNESLGKIRRDFAKRLGSDMPDGWTREETTYVAVTLAKLQNPEILAAKLKAASTWKNVKIIDAVSIQRWLDLAYSVDVWLYEECTGRSAEGYQTLSRAWSEWSSLTRPPITFNLVATAREMDAERICEVVTSGGELQIDADSPDEAVAFVHVALQRLPHDQRDSVVARALVISTELAAQRMPMTAAPQILVLKGAAISYAARLGSAGHQVIQVHGKNARSRRSGLALSRQPQREFGQALLRMGLDEQKASVESRACGSSPSVWRIWNLIHIADPTAILPKWADAAHADVVIPAIILGGWSERNPNDTEVVAALSGMSYARFRDRLMRANSIGEPLLEIAGDALVVAAPAVAFALVAKDVGQAVIQQLSIQIKNVFGQIDPQIDLDPDQRMYAGLDGKVLPHSSWLRDGMAGTLLRIAVIGEALEASGALGGGVPRQYFVDSCIRTLPRLTDDHRLLASLRDQLPVLAEAAPEPFLNALETLLQGNPSALKNIFAEGGDLGGHSALPGLLWALETLAWESKLLGRVACVLSDLNDIDPGGRLSNRPVNSLTEIFSAWNPGTTATVQERVDAVRSILDRSPTTGWMLLTKLLPNAQRISSGTHISEWRVSARPSTSRKDIGSLFGQYVDLAVEYSNGSPSRVAQLIRGYPGFSPKHRAAVEDAIERTMKQFPRGVLQDVWHALRHLIARHRELPDAAWALDGEVLNRLQDLCNVLSPDDPLQKHGWLFDDYTPDLPQQRDDYQAYNKEVERRRAVALRDIWSGQDRLDKLLRLVRQSGYPDLIAHPFGEIETDLNILIEVFVETAKVPGSLRIFASALAREAHNAFGQLWADAIHKVISGTKEKSARLDILVTSLLGHPDSVAHFEFVSAFGPELDRVFWERHNGFVSSDDKAVMRWAIRRFVDVGRAGDAVLAIGGANIGLSQGETLHVLDSCWEQINSGTLSPNTSSLGYWIEKTLDALRADPNADSQSIARAEYKWLPILVRHSDDKTLLLHEKLASDAPLFIDIICDLYKPENSERDATETSDENAKGRARAAWELLRSWKTPPGVTSDGNIDFTTLAAWVDNARSLAAIEDRRSVTDQHIGYILYHTPPDPEDQAWPHRAIRKLIENLANKNIESGIQVEQTNSRGFTTRGMFDGGAQERVLSQQWRKWSGDVGSRWPRTQALLERIATEWEAEAKREDISAQKNRIKHL